MSIIGKKEYNMIIHITYRSMFYGRAKEIIDVVYKGIAFLMLLAF